MRLPVIGRLGVLRLAHVIVPQLGLRVRRVPDGYVGQQVRRHFLGLVVDVAIEVVAHGTMHLHVGFERGEVVVVGLRPDECRHAVDAGLCAFSQRPEVRLVQDARLAHRVRGC